MAALIRPGHSAFGDRDSAIPELVRDHYLDAVFLADTRPAMSVAPNVDLRHFTRLDERLAANLDGLTVAADRAWRVGAECLIAPTTGQTFTLGVLAMRAGRFSLLRRLFALAEAVPETLNGLAGACGWLEARQGRALSEELSRSGSATERLVGIAAVAAHRLDGRVIASGFEDPSPEVRAGAFRAAAELGSRQYLSTCMAALASADPNLRFLAAWSAALLGNRTDAIAELQQAALGDSTNADSALVLALQALGPREARGLLERVAEDRSRLPQLVRGVGVSGDTVYVPWLIDLMSEVGVSRIAGEAFTTITGADLRSKRLSTGAPSGYEAGPTDDPDDPNVAMDAEEGLPWPDRRAVHVWWRDNREQFVTGRRYFLGAALTEKLCLQVLARGYQRQRMLAARHLCLMRPGTPLFDTAWPAWRQLRHLTLMG